MVVAGLAFFTCPVEATAALILGVAGLGQRQRNGLFAILGTVLSGVVVVALVFLLLSFLCSW